MTDSDIKEKLSKIAMQLLGCIDISDDCLYAIVSNSFLAITFITLIEEEFEIEFDDDDIDAEFFDSFDVIILRLKKYKSSVVIK